MEVISDWLYVSKRMDDNVQYFLSFLEGIITFVSPCLLPMLPIYISYFAGNSEQSTARTMKNAIGFVLGFTMVFVAMGALAGTVGSVLRSHQNMVNIVSGAVVILFGLQILGIIKWNLFHGNQKSVDTSNLGFFSSVIFGIVFSVGWTPCVGAFLGSALMMASQQGTMMTGIGMLLVYSMGLGIPFLISAILIDKLKNTFDWIKKNYKVVNGVSGALLIVVGLMMMTGTLGNLLRILS